MTYDARLFHHLFQPWYSTDPKLACLDCELSWRSSEGRTCWMCGEPGVTHSEFEHIRAQQKAAELAERAQTLLAQREEPNTDGQAP